MDREPKDHVSLSPEDAAFVNEQVRSGRYKSPEDVVRDGLDALRSLDDFHVANLDELRDKIEEGLRDVEAGRVVDGEQFFRDIDVENEGGAHQRDRKR